MSRPAPVSRPDAVPGGADFRRIFLEDVPLIDTRAPVEFERGAFPASVNLPLMTTAERASVGTCYKERGQAAAIALGHELVGGEVRAHRVAAWLDFARRHPGGYLYCWRGGMRSEICQQWMREAGCDYPRVGGGYKALRRFLIDELERICGERQLLLLGGHSGGDKTSLVRGWSPAVDLEGLAHHFGSSFGRRPGGQPTQLGFENRVAVALLKAEPGALASGRPILLEDESRLVGRCALPLPLQRRMARSPLVVLDVPLEERVAHTYHNYILVKQAEWRYHLGEEAGFEAFAEDLTQALHRLRKRLGGLRYRELGALLERALEAHRRGDPERHVEWIRPLLGDYYDPMYDHQLDKRRERVLFRGDRAAVRDYLASLPR